MIALAGTAAAATLAAGLFLIVYGLRGTTVPARIHPPHRWRTTVRRLLRPGVDVRARRNRTYLAALVVTVAGMVLSHLPVLALGLGAAVAFSRNLLPGTTVDNAEIRKLEGLADWVRRLAELFDTGNTLENVIPKSSAYCATVLKPSVDTLTGRIARRVPIRTALLRWADEVATRDADMVAAVLIANSEQRGDGMVSVLTRFATNLESQIKRRRDVETERAKPRAIARILTAMFGLTVVGGLFARDFTAPYRTPLGEVILAAMIAVTAGCLLMMKVITSSPPSSRLLVRPVLRDRGAGLASAFRPMSPIKNLKPTPAKVTR